MEEPQYTVFIRVPIPRRGFVDPPPVSWDTTKDKALLKIVTGAAQKEIDWHLVADRLEVPVDFLLQQAGFLTEGIRARLWEATAATKGSAAPSPVPGSDSAGVGHLRTASALSVRRDSPMPPGTAASANASARPAISRNTSTNTTVPRDAGSSSPRPGNKPAARLTEQAGRRRLSSLPMVSPTTKSPDPPLGAEPERTASPEPADDLSSTTSSDDESSPAQSRIIRRPPRYQPQHSYAGYRGDEDEESEPAFQPYRAPSSEASSHDLASTLRGDGRNGPRRSLKSSRKDSTRYSQTSDSSAGSHAIISRPRMSRGDQRAAASPSPRRTTELARSSRDGSDGTPSMGSSYSDLDDASVTQSALEEALASHMNHGAGSRFSISQAFRSRYMPGSNQ